MTVDPPFSRPVKVETLPREGLEQTIEANAEERAALARENNLVDLARLGAKFLIRKAARGVRVTGSLHAEATQTCVVTLEPFAVTLDEPVDVRFAPPAGERKRPEPEAVDVGEADEPDPLIDGRVDLGALAAEFLALALDPYPRKPGVEFASPEPQAEKDSPFDALGRLPREGE